MRMRVVLLLVAITAAPACGGTESSSGTTQATSTTTSSLGTTTSSHPVGTSSPVTTSTPTSIHVIPIAVDSGPLRDRVPGLNSDLRWMSEWFDINEAETAIELLLGIHRWALDRDEPDTDPTLFEFSGTLQDSSYDPSGSFLAVVTQYDLFDLPNLIVADETGSTVISEEVRWGAVWHVSQPSVAFLEQVGEAEAALRVADISPGQDGPVASITTITTVPSLRAALLGFADWGYLVGIDDHEGAALFVLDPEGEPLAAVEAWPLAWVGPDRMVVESVAPGPGLVFDIEPMPIAEGLQVIDLAFEPVPVADDSLALLRATELTDDQMIAPIDDRRFVVVDLSRSPAITHITVASLTDGVLAVVTVDDVWAPSGFVGRGRYLVFQMDSGEFLFLDWEAGTAIRTPVVDPVPEDPYAAITRIIAISGG